MVKYDGPVNRTSEAAEPADVIGYRHSVWLKQKDKLLPPLMFWFAPCQELRTLDSGPGQIRPFEAGSGARLAFWSRAAWQIECTAVLGGSLDWDSQGVGGGEENALHIN